MTQNHRLHQYYSFNWKGLRHYFLKAYKRWKLEHKQEDFNEMLKYYFELRARVMEQ